MNLTLVTVKNSRLFDVLKTNQINQSKLAQQTKNFQYLVALSVLLATCMYILLH